MPDNTFTALLLEQEDGKQTAALKTLSRDDLPDGDVLISVAYSSLNYKDGLAVTGKAKVVRSFPMVPGIDLAGTVVESASPEFAPGDAVVLTGWGIGEKYWGGYAQMARAKAGWLVPLPENLTPKQAMGIGTAGFTAMLCVLALEAHGLSPEQGEVVVTGAAGGVGSVAAAILANLGYTVVASTGRESAHEYLRALGVSEIIDRGVLGEVSKRPLESGRWAGAVDTVGGDTLAQLLKTVRPHGSVAACGNAGGVALNTTVLPFILRGVNLLGIDSVMCPVDLRRTAWQRLATDLPLDALEQVMQVAPLADVPALSQEILQGNVRGRIVIDVNA
ncbi:MAG: oxidoreductase [Chloroflexi bacterium]|nr:MAG: oxidoreductase [Chloroflexota bacterium]